MKLVDLKKRVLSDKCMGWDDLESSAEWLEFVSSIREGSLRTAAGALAAATDRYSERLDLRSRDVLARITLSFSHFED